MYVIDDYIDGIVYAAETLEDMENGLPYDIKGVFENLKFSKKGRVLVQGDEAADIDIVYFKMKRKKLLKYMTERNASNFIRGV